MNLKKSDKIIVLVAVVILILAAIGVILYTDKEPKMNLVLEEMFNYKVIVETNTDSLKLDNTDFTITSRNPYTGTFEVFTDNLKDIEIHVDYEDKDPGILRFLKERRKNTLIVTVYDEFENQLQSTTITGIGNDTLYIYGSEALNIDEITAKDINDAREKLTENLSSTGLTKKYTIVVSVKYGEIRLLKKIGEILRKDSFSIDIITHHYDYQLEKIENPNGNDDYKETNIQLGYTATTYVSTNYIGFH